MFEHNVYSKENRTIIDAWDSYPATVPCWQCNGCGKVFGNPPDSLHCDVCLCEIFQQEGPLAKGVTLTFHSGALDVDTAVRHTKSLVKHITFVREAGEKLGVDKVQLEQHDFSKWSYDEFLPYAINFQGDKSPVLKGNAKEDFARAWMHHIHHNPHHWQHWIFPDGYSPEGARIENGVMVMPNVYALEMIADWMGASMAYTGSWDMTQWLYQNMPKIRLHSLTADYIRGVLDMLGYADTVFAQRFAHEI
jgi:hypothetical protein